MADDYWIKRYDIPSVKHEGWAVIVVDSKGFLGIVSDHGNWSYHWTSFGEDFKEFLLKLTADGYLANKLTSGERELDPKKTEAGVREFLKEYEDDFSEEFMEEEKNRLPDYLPFDMQSFSSWVASTEIEAADEFASYDTPYHVRTFCRVIWPRFIEKLKKDPPC